MSDDQKKILQHQLSNIANTMHSNMSVGVFITLERQVKVTKQVITGCFGEVDSKFSF